MSAETIYRVASNPADYRKCHELARIEDTKIEDKLTWPTVMAVRGKEILGFLSTRYDDPYIVAGPLVTKETGLRAFRALRLVEAYERLLRAAGVSQYVFFIERRLKNWVEDIKSSMEIEPYAEDEHGFWFERRI